MRRRILLLLAIAPVAPGIESASAQEAATPVCLSPAIAPGSTYKDADTLRQACALAKFTCNSKLNANQDAAQYDAFLSQCIADDVRRHFPNAEQDVATYEEEERLRLREERAQEQAREDAEARRIAPVVEACASSQPVYLVRERRTVRTIPDARAAAQGRCRYLWGSGRFVADGSLPYSAFRAVMPGDPPPMGTQTIIRIYPPRF